MYQEQQLLPEPNGKSFLWVNLPAELLHRTQMPCLCKLIQVLTSGSDWQASFLHALKQVLVHA